MFRISMTAALLATGGAAFAQDARFERYGDAGGWTIFADTESGGCFIEKAVGDYVVQMGSEATIIGDGDGADFAYFAVFVQDTVDLAEGETEDVEFRIGDDIFFGTATGAKRNDGFEGAFVDSNNRNFAQDIADEQTMFIDLDNDTRVEIDLTGTRVAMEAGLECAAS